VIIVIILKVALEHIFVIRRGIVIVMISFMII
jgi:hypothetical protein